MIQLDVETRVRRGSARGEGWKNIKGKRLLVVSAEDINGIRRDIDSSVCPFLYQGLIDHINDLEST